MSENNEGFGAPGTFALAIIFLATFIIFYFLNYKYLSSLWELR